MLKSCFYHVFYYYNTGYLFCKVHFYNKVCIITKNCCKKYFCSSHVVRCYADMTIILLRCICYIDITVAVGSS